MPVLIPQYMVAMGIKGSDNQGLKSQAWTDQTPSAGWEGFFAGASNIIFTFGGLGAGAVVGATGTPEGVVGSQACEGSAEKACTESHACAGM